MLTFLGSVATPPPCIFQCSTLLSAACTSLQFLLVVANTIRSITTQTQSHLTTGSSNPNAYDMQLHSAPVNSCMASNTSFMQAQSQDCMTLCAFHAWSGPEPQAYCAAELLMQINTLVKHKPVMIALKTSCHQQSPPPRFHHIHHLCKPTCLLWFHSHYWMTGTASYLQRTLSYP